MWPSGTLHLRSLPLVFPPATGERRLIRVVIDEDACSGNGRCYSLVPELFTDDERGYGQVVDGGEFAGDRREMAERAVRACPEDAIRIEEG